LTPIGGNMENQDPYLQTNAVGMASFDLVISLMYLLVGKGIITHEEVKELIKDKVYQTDRLEPLPTNPAELSPVEVKRVFKSILKTLDKFESQSEEDTEKLPTSKD
jgi:hypothetical protein